MTKKCLLSELQLCLWLNHNLAVLMLLFVRKKYPSCILWKKGVREIGDWHYLGMKRAGGGQEEGS